MASPLDDPCCIFNELKYASEINWKPNGENSMIVSSPKELFPNWDHGLDFVEKPLQDSMAESIYANKDAYKADTNPAVNPIRPQQVIMQQCPLSKREEDPKALFIEHPLRSL